MEEASQPQQENALDHKWYLFHMGEAWNSYLYTLVFTKLLIWYWISHCDWSNELESNDNPLLQDSKREIDWHMHTYISKDMISAYSHI